MGLALNGVGCGCGRTVCLTEEIDFIQIHYTFLGRKLKHVKSHLVSSIFLVNFSMKLSAKESEVSIGGLESSKDFGMVMVKNKSNI